jgi:hypothetical protein
MHRVTAPGSASAPRRAGRRFVIAACVLVIADVVGVALLFVADCGSTACTGLAYDAIWRVGGLMVYFATVALVLLALAAAIWLVTRGIRRVGRSANR